MRRFVVREMSMAPALREGDRLVTRRRPPRRGELVVFPQPAGSQVWYVKRVVGIDGDTVHLEDGLLRISGPEIEPTEHVVHPEPRPRHWSIGPEEAFVLSDSTRITRADSRVFGPIDITTSQVVVFRYGPPRRIKRLS